MTTPLTALLASFDVDDHPGRIIERVMQAARDHVGLEVSFVSEFAEGQRVFRYASGDLERFEVRVDGAEPLEGTYCQMVCDGTLDPLVLDASRHPVTASMPVTGQLGVEVYVGVPVELSDGRLYGTLCCLSSSPTQALSDRDVGFMRMAAAIVAEQLEREEATGLERRVATARIRAALAGGFDLVYQPIVDLAGGGVLGYEALARFDGAVQRRPDEWFEEAWLVGLGVDLELAAVRRAVAVFGQIPAPAYLAVNVSPETLLSPDIPAALAGATPERLVLEITEHARVLDYAPVRERIDALRAQGYRVAIDDLGTGHAGVNHLLQFQPDVLKIDLSVVQGVRRDPLRRAIAATFATLAASIGASIVAEGIETAEDRDALEILGLTAGQGYHLARPGPLAEVLQVVGAPPAQREPS